MPTEKTTRDETIKALVQEGQLTNQQIGQRFGISDERVGQIAGRKANSQNYHTASTTRQYVWQFILRFSAEHHGLPPSIREIMEGTGLGSTSVVWHHLQKLAAQNKINYTESGSYYLPGATWTPPNP